MKGTEIEKFSSPGAEVKNVNILPKFRKNWAKIDCKNLLKKARSLEKNAATLKICEIWEGGAERKTKN